MIESAHGEGHSSVRMAGLLSARFRAGMRPLAVGTGLCVALSAPLADFLLERHDISERARQLATEVVGHMTRVERNTGAISHGDAVAVAKELEQAQVSHGAEEIARIEIVGTDGSPFARSQSKWAGRSWPLIQAEAPLLLSSQPPRRIVVTVGEREWLYRDLLLLSVFSLLGTVLGLALYFFPLRLFREEDLVRLFAWRAIKAAEEERLRLSRDLHDGVGQSLGAAAVATARLVGRTGASAEATETARLIDASLEEVRRVARGLRPPSLDDLGLGAAVAGLAREAAGTGLEVNADIGDLPRIDPEVEQTCFRLAQEALANVVRHAHASTVRITLGQHDDNVVLEVQDDGAGFSPSVSLGLGLVGARERAARLSGTLDIDSARGKGTRLRATLPVRAALH